MKEEEDLDSAGERTQPAQPQMQLPVVELMKVCSNSFGIIVILFYFLVFGPCWNLGSSFVQAAYSINMSGIFTLQDFMSGKAVFRNIMSILLPGVNAVIAERGTQIYGQLLEKAVHLSLEIIILVLEKDLPLADFWRPVYQVYICESSINLQIWIWAILFVSVDVRKG